jgi:hypothetical protein
MSFASSCLPDHSDKEEIVSISDQMDLQDTVLLDGSLWVNGRQIMITDTIVTDEGLVLIEHRSSYSSSFDSIEVYEGPIRLRAVRLNDGGYQGEHTSLEWTNRDFLCFSFGCGSPCWGSQFVDLRDTNDIQALYTVLSDSVRNLYCYSDHTDDPKNATFTVRSLLSGGSSSVTLPLRVPTAFPFLEVDSVWIRGDSLILRRSADGYTRSVGIRHMK